MSAITVVVADKGRPTLVWISLIPIVLFAVLDSYYLALEKDFRQRYEAFIRKLHQGVAKVDDVFIVAPRRGIALTFSEIAGAAKSMSVWPFYALLAVMMAAIKTWVL